jgi:hypothetical protein
MGDPFRRWSRLFPTAGIALSALFLGASGCEEDPAVHPLPPGRGTLEQPYIIQAGYLYTEIPVAPGGTVFVIAEGVGPDFYVLKAQSEDEDIELDAYGFESFSGEPIELESTGSTNGIEMMSVLGDGEQTRLFFALDGSRVRRDDTTFDVSAGTAPAPGGVTRELDACPYPAPLPPTQCGDEGGPHNAEIDLPFVMASRAELSVRLATGSGEWLYLRARTEDEGAPYLPFPSNDPVFDASGEGFCHVNLGVKISPQTCSGVNPVSGWPPVRSVRVTNNSQVPGVNVTVSFSSP